ncbi:MAG: lyase [Nocardioidaceae bacterium]|nr:lyase [Nocardioidaceae bacterium]
MPELPEVEGLTDFLRRTVVGSFVTRVDVASISALKTYDPPATALAGLEVVGVARHGKWIDLDVDGLHLVFHLAKAGWLRWADVQKDARPKPGGPIAARVHLDSGAGFDLTEAGTRKSLAIYVVRDPGDIPAIAALGPDPLSPAFDRDALAAMVAGRRMQIKGLLRDQKVIAGIGNAYSDEVLHAAKLSPFARSDGLSDEQIDRLYVAIRDILAAAIDVATGKPAAELKDAKRSGMRVHGRTGEACPVCGDTVAEVSFADRSLQYCPTCQTGGKPLANRTTSKFLK